MDSSETGFLDGWVSGSLWDMTGRAKVITFIGAGGKTTCLRSITQEINASGRRVIATTSTKVFPEKTLQSWENPCCPPPKEQIAACFWYAKGEEKSGKWVGPSLEVMDEAIEQDILSFEREDIQVNPKRFWVIEGDGARAQRLKCWGPQEPQIPVHSECAVLVSDGGLWGRVLQVDLVHRSERCPDLLGRVWKAENAWSYFLTSPVFAPQYEHMSWVILLNCHGEKAENEDSGGLVEPLEILQDLRQTWAEIQGKAIDPKSRPKHLRVAAGDAKEGKLQWFDLW